jgi:hypothetical protein
MRVKLQGENDPLDKYYISFKTWTERVFPSLWNFPESLWNSVEISLALRKGEDRELLG